MTKTINEWHSWAGYLNEDLLRLWFTTLSAPQDLSISVLVCCFWLIDAFLTCSESTLYAYSTLTEAPFGYQDWPIQHVVF